MLLKNYMGNQKNKNNYSSVNFLRLAFEQAKINLGKIKTSKIFNWLKNNGIPNKEMIKTFNCGVGFCLIIERKNLKKIDKFFSKEYKPYVIGKISEDKNKVILNGSINW